YGIGCIMVASPVFLPEELWVREPKGWAPTIVRGRGEDLTQAEGLRIFTECLDRAQHLGAHHAVRVRRHAPGHQRAAAQKRHPPPVRPWAT
ncbi:MAG: hypothetical protein U1E29_00560, partial [Coriobacteriia bacterium]|nr:hypothetical protein [Coriobacteriia bacterium]